MFGIGSRVDVVQRARSINWRTLSLYGLTVAVTVMAGWATSRLG